LANTTTQLKTLKQPNLMESTIQNEQLTRQYYIAQIKTYWESCLEAMTDPSRSIPEQIYSEFQAIANFKMRELPNLKTQEILKINLKYNLNIIYKFRLSTTSRSSKHFKISFSGLAVFISHKK
jgi:hypothetical protein